MKTKHFILYFLLIFSVDSFCQQVRNFKNEAYQLRNVLSEKHVEPRLFDDKLSSDIFNLTIQELDPSKLYFTSADIQWLEAYRTLIDDEIKGNNWAFLNRLKERYESSLKRTIVNINEILKTEMEFDTNEFYDEEPLAWSNDDATLKNRQRLWLKSRILEKISILAEYDSISCDQALISKKTESIHRVKKAEVRSIQNILSTSENIINHVGTVFFRAITGVFDPHTLYFSPSELKNFIGQLATEDYYFGFTLDENSRGQIAIASLAPGSPAWKSGELHVSDVLLSLKPEGNQAIEFTEISIDEANQLLTTIESEVIDFTVRKADGIEKTVRLKKEKMQAEENFVRSFILHGSQKFGYIHLPDFYTRWGDETQGSRCANDVAREILKLKKDGIQGLVLDLRFNGGGSLYEAMAMSGIFIDEGALGILRDRERTVTLRDVNRGTIYDGPLVILVNGQSASASEFLAAAIQDYNRGLIIGSQTYGKATGQNIIPINPVSKASSLDGAIDKSEGFIKITTERLYRVTGKSLQGKGVKPDIILPDLFAALSYHESDVPFSLTPDSVIKNTYFKPLAEFNRTALLANSKIRIKENKFFRDVENAVTILSEDAKGNDPVTLAWSEFCKETEDSNRLISFMENHLTAPPVFIVTNNSFEEQRLKVDTYADEYNKRWFQKLQNDLYLVETFHVLSDLALKK